MPGYQPPQNLELLSPTATISTILIKVSLTLQNGVLLSRTPGRFITLTVPLRIPFSKSNSISAGITTAIQNLILQNNYHICVLAELAGISTSWLLNEGGTPSPDRLKLGFLFEGEMKALLILDEPDMPEGRFENELLTVLEWGEKTGWRDTLAVHVLMRAWDSKRDISRVK